MCGIGLLGAGIFATTAHLPAILKCQDLSLKAVYSRSEGSAQSLAAASRKLGLPGIDVYHGSDGLAKVLSRDDIQTVVVCLPITFQPEIIQAAWRAGKNVISEKPIAKDVATAKQLIDIYETTYRSTGIQWIIAEQFPYETAYVKVHEMLSQGVIGELRSFSLEWNNNVTPENPYYNTAWRKNPEYQGGFLLDGGVHFVAGIRYLLSALGVQMASVSAFNCLIRDDLAPFDTLQGVIKTDNERVGGTFIISMAHEVSKPSGYVIRGSKAIITVVRQGPRMSLKILQNGQEEEVASIHVQGVEQEFQAFAKALVDGPDSHSARDVQSRSGSHATLLDVSFIENALQSSQSGSWHSLY